MEGTKMRQVSRGESTGQAGVSRRDFLRSGGVGHASCGVAFSGTGSPSVWRSSPERSVILLMLVGGPSQLESLDPKPDAPAEIRGPFGSIPTRIPGVRVSEHLP